MASRTTLEQHIAVFGESGSGKTVLLSSFYGAAQEPQAIESGTYRLLADDAGQGNRLQGNYLGMKRSSQLPPPTRFEGDAYSFTVRLKDEAVDGKKPPKQAFDALKLVWHDYPGEWFEQAVSGDEEAQRKVATFRALLGSDVALFLVDGQRLLDNAGEEQRYLKSLFTNFRNGLLSIKDDLLVDGEPLVKFPRIWMLALSKADLLPDLDVFGFRDLVIEKAHGEINELRTVIAGLIQDGDALAVGEDFVLLSSARFTPGQIEVNERVGVKLMLPIAAVLPFQRHVRWSKVKNLSRAVNDELLDKGLSIATGLVGGALLGGKFRLPGPLGALQTVAGLALSKGALDNAANQAGGKLKELRSRALDRHDMATATLTGFGIDLETAEHDKVLLRSPK